MNTTATPSPSNAPTAASPSAPAQPTYDSGLRFDSGVRYANSVSSLPPNDGGVVKFAPSVMSDSELLEFCTGENTDVTSNPNFPTPMPSVADLAAAIAAYQATMNSLVTARSALRDATANKDTARATLEAMMKIRAGYVQAASNGNSNMIINAGFQVRSAPTPVGMLPAPVNLQLVLNGSPGLMFLTWDAVPNARGYNIQMADADTSARNWQLYRTVTAPRQTLADMEIGKTYAFRVSAIGGSTGQSVWSIEVTRMAA